MPNNLLPFDGEVYLFKQYMSGEILMSKIIDEVSWRSDKIKMFGKEFDQKRKVAWVGDRGISYTYSRISLVANGWTPEIKKIRERIFKDFRGGLNSCLVNLYRSGEDYMSYHADNEMELGKEPIIFSLSFGENRDFYLKHNESATLVKINLEDGDLLIMRGKTQDCWKHSLPKRKKVSAARLNLTFRCIYSLK